jgi:hypothetical protein
VVGALRFFGLKMGGGENAKLKTQNWGE